MTVVFYLTDVPLRSRLYVYFWPTSQPKKSRIDRRGSKIIGLRRDVNTKTHSNDRERKNWKLPMSRLFALPLPCHIIFVFGQQNNNKNGWAGDDIFPTSRTSRITVSNYFLFHFCRKKKLLESLPFVAVHVVAQASAHRTWWCVLATWCFTSTASHVHYAVCSLRPATQQVFVADVCSAASITRRSFSCKFWFEREVFQSVLCNLLISSTLNSLREASNIPLQQIPFAYQSPPTAPAATTQQKGRPRKRKALQTDETILTSPDGPPEHHHHLNHDGTLRLGEFFC